VLEDLHNHKVKMGRPGKKAVNGATEDEPSRGEDQGINNILPQQQNHAEISEAKERRLKELEDQVSRKQKELEECHARAREKSLKQRIEEAEATLRELNEQLQSASHEVINIEDPNVATKVSKDKNSQKSFISIDTSSPSFNRFATDAMTPGLQVQHDTTFDGQSDPSQFLMSFEVAVISIGGDETTLAKSLVIAVRGPAQKWYSSLKAKSIHSWD